MAMSLPVVIMACHSMVCEVVCCVCVCEHRSVCLQERRASVQRDNAGLL